MSPTSLAESPPRAALQPRVDVHPPLADTLGGAAADLAALAGLHLDPWQRDGLDLLCGYRPDGLWACPEYVEMVGRQNGKGAIAEARALAGLLLFGEELILWTAHEVKTAMRAFRRLKRLVRRLSEQVGNDENLRLIDDERISAEPILIKICNGNGDEGFERIDELGEVVQELRYIARSKGSGRGFTGDLLFIDETFAYTDEQNEAVFSALSARPNPQVVYTSTPPLTGTTGTVLYALRKRALAGDDPDLAYRDWGLAGDLEDLEDLLKQWGTTLGDPHLVAASNPAYGGRLTTAWLARETRALSRLGYARERLGLWPRQLGEGSTIIDLDAWRSWRDPQSAATGMVAFSLDSTPDGAWSAIGMTGRRLDGLRHWQILEHRPGDIWLVEVAKALNAEVPNVGWFIDPQSPAGSHIADLRNAGLTVHEITGRDLAQACTSMKRAAKEGEGRYPPFAVTADDSDEFVAAWRDAGQVDAGDGLVRFVRKRSGNIAPLMVVTLSDHGFRVHGESDSSPWALYA